MALPSSSELFDVLDATWPAAEKFEVAEFVIRDGQGGGKRASAATSKTHNCLSNVDLAEAAMVRLGQTPLFQLRDEEDQLDQALEALGYTIVDPVVMYAIPVTDLLEPTPPRTAAIPAWEPLRIMEEIWAHGGIGPERVEVMKRVLGPKTGLISRWQDKPAGAAFLGLHKGVGMVHALEILPFQRRQGVARFLMQRAAIWTAQQGGTHLAVVCTRANEAANALYSGLGMTAVGAYRYRQKIKT
ncbi:GNAT family N-acetyltransferase [Shimia marina]|uniref:Putative acetyltransferase n=1 Tax=Shimia marina TaxID=321267 RepID=A0A0P1ELM8_9RHOB|nr:GNAT family N-acetyltransferase [Shimia marina]CUH51008.1 putative acetyltransferase [Shimia marina]SFD60479.1 Acetyltransferase (GNAT) family protein [Shimia marina]